MVVSLAGNPPRADAHPIANHVPSFPNGTNPGFAGVFENYCVDDRSREIANHEISRRVLAKNRNLPARIKANHECTRMNSNGIAAKKRKARKKLKLRMHAEERIFKGLQARQMTARREG